MDMMLATVRAKLDTVLEEIIACRQRHGDVFAMCGSYPPAPFILTAAMFGGATVTAVACESDHESVKLDLISQYQDSREGQIQRYFAREQQEQTQQRQDQIEMVEQAHLKVHLAFEEHAIRTRQYANPHLDHCPLTTKLYEMCECSPSPSVQSDKSCPPETGDCGIRFGHRNDACENVFDAGNRRERAMHASSPLRADVCFHNRQPTLSQPDSLSTQQCTYSLEEREAALAKFRSSLGLPHPPQVTVQPFPYNWRFEDYPEVRQALTGQCAQYQSQGLWSGCQPAQPWDDQPAQSWDDQPFDTVHQSNALSSLKDTAASSATPDTSSSTEVRRIPSTTSTQPILSANRAVPNGPIPFTTSPTRFSYTTPTPSFNTSLVTTSNGLAASASTSENTSAGTSLFAPPSIPTIAPTFKPVVLPLTGDAYPPLASNPITRLIGKSPKNKEVETLMLALLRPWAVFDRDAPVIQTQTLADSCDDLMYKCTYIHQYVAPNGVWETSKIGINQASQFGFKGLEWERIRIEFGACVQMQVNTPEYQTLQNAWDAFDALGRIVPDSVVGYMHGLT